MLAVFRATKATVEIYQMDARCKPNCLGTTGNCLVYGALEKLARNASHTVVFVYAQCAYTVLHLLGQIGVGGLKCRYAGDNFAVLLDTKVESRWVGVLRVDYVRNIHAGAHYVTAQNVKLGGIVVVDCHCCFSVDDMRTANGRPLQIGIMETSLRFHLQAGAFAKQKFDHAQNDNDKDGNGLSGTSASTFVG